MGTSHFSEGQSEIIFQPGPVDVHTHPRVFDAISQEDFLEANGGMEGKAGLLEYTAVALRSGITAMLAMPNESIRLYDPSSDESTILVPYPIANLDRVRAVQSKISQEAYLPVGIHYGLDPEHIFTNEAKENIDDEKLHRNFEEVSEECMGLKIYGAETTGGYNLHTRHIPRVIDIWSQINPEKPVTLHLEDEDVGRVLTEIHKLQGGKNIPVHIAHVSSRLELLAVITAKKAGMNVTCEVTPHHLTLDESVIKEIGGYGCMKPTLKTQEDIDFIWANIDSVDIFASDCAPHRRSDKEAKNPSYGVTNHTVMLPILIGAVAQGKLSLDQLNEKLCLNPRRRFSLPMYDGSHVSVKLAETTARGREEAISPRYGHEPFSKLGKSFFMLGRVVEVQAGKSYWSEDQPDMHNSYTHLIRPKVTQHIRKRS